MVKTVNLEEVADYVVNTVINESLLTGFQLIVYFEELEKRFGALTEDDLTHIYDLLQEREEVADVIQTEDSYDVVIYTAYAKNYCEEEWDW